MYLFHYLILIIDSCHIHRETTKKYRNNCNIFEELTRLKDFNGFIGKFCFDVISFLDVFIRKSFDGLNRRIRDACLRISLSILFPDNDG